MGANLTLQAGFCKVELGLNSIFWDGMKAYPNTVLRPLAIGPLLKYSFTQELRMQPVCKVELYLNFTFWENHSKFNCVIHIRFELLNFDDEMISKVFFDYDIELYTCVYNMISI